MTSNIAHDAFSHVTDWVFDLDNTLYPRHCDLFSQIDWRMTAYVAELTGLERDEARQLQKRLYREHGTTLNGLMREFAIDPLHYLADVHDIDYSRIEHNPALGEAIARLPGRKHIFTNGDVRHAENTLAALGIPVAWFDSLFDIVASDFNPKPMREPYDAFLKAHAIRPESAAMFEDMPRNLTVPKQLGMVTVLIVPMAGKEHAAEAWELEGESDPHIDHVTDDIHAFLTEIASCCAA
ncbi:MAG: pyrimidine 5'-nucleotidase [Nitratireductor sp.]|nr:pyrimidine 5'-nucleotidase [Nitratireductor sp.]